MFADTDLAWAAGIIDGEGSIGAYTQGNSTNILSVTVGSTDFRMVQKLYDMFGGHLREANPCASGRTFWHWKATAKCATSMLQLVLPYLVTKREQAEVALVFSGTTGRPERQELADKLREMKKAVR